MNEEQLSALLEKELRNVPSEIQSYIRGDAFPGVLREVVGEFSLHLDVAYEVEVQTILLLLGLQTPSQYVANLEKEAGLEKARAVAIAKRMDERVMRPIYESYKKDAKTFTNPFAEEESVEKRQGETPRAELPAEERIEKYEQAHQVSTPPAPEQKERPVKKYAMDPYREPIE